MAEPTATDTAASVDPQQLTPQAVIDRLAGEMWRLIGAEAAGNVEQGRFIALGAVVGGLRWLQQQEGGALYVANVVDQLHREAHAGLALAGMPAASEVRQ